MIHPILIKSNGEIYQKIPWITRERLEKLAKWAATIWPDDTDCPPTGRGPKK